MKNQKSFPSTEKPAQLLKKSLLKLSRNKLLILGVLVVLFAIFSIFANNLLTLRSILNLLVQTSIFIILSIGATLVLIIGGIDFSLGAVVAFSGTAVVVFAGLGIPIWLSMLAAISLGGMLGFSNGFLVASLRLPSFISAWSQVRLPYWGMCPAGPTFFFADPLRGICLLIIFNNDWLWLEVQKQVSRTPFICSKKGRPY